MIMGPQKVVGRVYPEWHKPGNTRNVPAQMTVDGKLYDTRVAQVSKVDRWKLEGWVNHSTIQGTDMVLMIRIAAEQPKAQEQKPKPKKTVIKKRIKED